ncbi:MAG: High-affinity branched-chain amino acid transport system permease protein LivH [Verrucomicrobiota bacterium]
MKVFPLLPCLLALLFATPGRAAATENPRALIARAATEAQPAQARQLLAAAVGRADESVAPLLDAWRRDALFLHAQADGGRVAVLLTGEKDERGAQSALRAADGQPLQDEAGRPVRLVATDLPAAEHDASLRRTMKAILDLAELAAVDPTRRARSVRNLGLAQDAEKLPVLLARESVESAPEVRRALREAIALLRLRDPREEIRVAALQELQAVSSLATSDLLARVVQEEAAAGNRLALEAARRAQQAVEWHRTKVDFAGTLFRGLSLGSILLVAALGLAITFGLMRVINMAHGELIAVGAYTTYLTQAVFGTGMTLPCFGLSVPIPGLQFSGASREAYFIAALPASFLAAATVGLLLERGIIHFLYRRPLESLLATWGVSLVLQQAFRLIFGANNVQVSSPYYLSGNWLVGDVILGWNRVFVIGFALLIVLGMGLVLTRTSLGLLIRASMQNRTMAACLGVRTERVNALTFALGSGLAGLAGAFLSQIGNVGPSIGQGYIIDSFMVVVVGGVGSLGGTILSAFGIGGVDQVLQQYLPLVAPGLAWVPGIGGFLQNLAQDAAVFGKILVLAGIILFLQWRPAGLFAPRSRSLDE